MTQPHAHPPAKEAAQSDAVRRRSRLADAYRMKEWIWDVVLIIGLLIVGSAVSAIALSGSGFWKTNLTLEKTIYVAVPAMVLGVLLMVVAFVRLASLRKCSSANLTALTEAEGIDRLYSLATGNTSVGMVETLAQSTVALTRGLPMKAEMTNQTLELSRREVKAGGRSPAEQLLKFMADRSQPDGNADRKEKKTRAGGSNPQ